MYTATTNEKYNGYNEKERAVEGDDSRAKGRENIDKEKKRDIRLQHSQALIVSRVKTSGNAFVLCAALF